MSSQITNDTWNTWIMGSKSANIEIELRKWATINNVSIVSMYSKEGIINKYEQFQASYRRSWIEKLLGIRSEVVYLHLEGDYFKLCELRDIILSRHWILKPNSWPGTVIFNAKDFADELNKILKIPLFKKVE